jgi:spore maturation protein CgeB
VEHLRNLTPEDAAIIGSAARRRVLAEHTYANRVAQLEKILCEDRTLTKHMVS